MEIPDTFVALLEQVTKERDEALAELETYRKSHFERGIKIRDLETRNYQLSSFSSKELANEVVEREENLRRKYNNLLSSSKERDDE